MIFVRLCVYLACFLPPALALAEHGPFLQGRTASGLQVQSLPLAVRNPYLSAWLPGTQVDNLPTAQAEFWNNNVPLGWTILAQVNGKTFTLFGAPNGIANTTAAVQKSINYTATHTVAELGAGAASITVDFFSPVSPNNFLRQSLPFSYVTITVTGSSDVQILSAISDSWYGQASQVSTIPGTGLPGIGQPGKTLPRYRNKPRNGQPGTLVSQYQNKGATFMISLTDPNADHYSEDSNEMATWGSIVLATSQAGVSSVSHQSGPADSVFGTFVKSGRLNGTLPTYAPGDWIAFAQKLRNVFSIGGMTNPSYSVTFAVGQYRENVINYLGNDQVGFFKSAYDNVLDAVDGFLDEYQSAYSESHTLDGAIYTETISISSNYTDLTTAVVRQCYGAMEITLPASDTANTKSPYIFLKEISTNGDTNTVDVIYPTSTILGVLSPDWIKYLLEPVAQFCSSSAWTADYPVHDLGTYPNALGRTTASSEQMMLEVTGSFLIMAYQYQKLTGDTSWAHSHANLFQKFADYLTTNGLYPSNQVDTVDSISASPNQTNLAITSAIGLKAYGALTGNQVYTTMAQNFANTIYTNEALGTNLWSHSTSINSSHAHGLMAKSTPKHFTYNYGNTTSWGTVFSLFPDQWLGLNTFPSSAVSMQCAWYMTQATSVGIPYGSPQDNIANGMWDMWIAASCPSDADAIIGFEHAFFTNGLNDVPFPDRFYVSGSSAGTYVQAHARPTVGTTFGLLLGKGVSLAKYLSS